MKVPFSFSSALAINPEFIGDYLPVITALIKGDTSSFSEPHLLTAPIESIAIQAKEENSKEILVIALAGVVTKYNDYWDGTHGTLSIVEILNQAYADDSIAGVILKLDSPGGEARACYHVYEAIVNRNKPVIAFVDDLACSAAYYMAAPADLIIANYKTAQIGSIGVLTTVADYREYFEKLGIKIEDVYSSFSKDKNSEFRSYLDGDKEPLIKKLDVIAEDFISNVEKGRGEKLKADRKEWGTGKVYFAEEALELGLIDAIDSFSNISNYFSNF